MSYKLEYPYTDEERANFIVEYNHNQGLRIEEVDNFVEVEVEGEVEPYITIQNQPTLYALEANEILVDDKPIINPNYKKEQRLQAIEVELQQADETYQTQLDTPVQYTNGHLYKPKWAEETYISLLTAGSMIPTMFPMLIWDSTEVEENATLMELQDLQELTMYLAGLQQQFFNARKALKSQLLNEKKELEDSLMEQ